jgi:hypothetical protein
MEIIDWGDSGLTDGLDVLWILDIMNHLDPSSDQRYNRRSRDGAVQLARDIYPYMSDSEAEDLLQHGRVNVYAKGRLVITLTLIGTKL